MRFLFREAILSALAQKLASGVTLLLVAGMCASVLLTSGKAEGSQQAVLATIDTAGPRSIIVRASPDAGLTSEVLGRLESLEGIEAAVALGSARDVRNALLPDGALVPLRDYWGEAVGSAGTGEALASKSALEALGMQQAVGSVSNDEGTEVSIVGLVRDPGVLDAYEPLLLTPRSADDIDEVGILVLIAHDATAVAAITEVIQPIVAGLESGQVKIQSSEQLARLRNTINQQLGTFGSALAAGSLVTAGVLVAVVQSALVLLRRKDWGRRRALGASRPLILALLVAQTSVLAVAGAALGLIVSFAVLLVWRSPVPSISFALAVAILAIGVAMVSALLPAFIASRRDPIKELRVP